jgi:hypothetical protein
MAHQNIYNIPFKSGTLEYKREWRKLNRDKENQYVRNWRSKNTAKWNEYVRARWQADRENIPIGGRCEICGGAPNRNCARLDRDHCHKSGINRGLLCRRCNIVLGQMEDSEDNLRAMLAYLEKWNAKIPGK